MSLNFEQTKHINPKIKNLVFGFIRNVQPLLPQNNVYYNIPEIVFHGTLLFYNPMDEWDKKYVGKGDTLKGNSITHNTLSHSSSFGSIIASDSGEYHWKFRLQNIGEQSVYWSVVIGIWKVKSNDEPPIHTYFTSSGYKNNELTYKCGYAYNVNMGTLVDNRGENAKHGGPYGVKCKSGDIVSMTLNFTDLTLKYNVNGKDMGIAFKNIENTKYRAALSMSGKGNVVELM